MDVQTEGPSFHVRTIATGYADEHDLFMIQLTWASGADGAGTDSTPRLLMSPKDATVLRDELDRQLAFRRRSKLS